MYCSNCGRQLEDEARYCSACGTPRSGVDQPAEKIGVEKRLSRPREGTKIAGVCAGVARYLDLDVTLVRILWILVTSFHRFQASLRISCAGLQCLETRNQPPRIRHLKISPSAQRRSSRLKEYARYRVFGFGYRATTSTSMAISASPVYEESSIGLSTMSR